MVSPSPARRTAAAYLAQHDFVHVLADYGTNLKGELEVFAFIGRADPDPKGFAWLATLIGLFETGSIRDAGFFKRDVRERNVQAPGMHHRIADAIRRGKVVSEGYGTDLFEVDYHTLAGRRHVERCGTSWHVPPSRPRVFEAARLGRSSSPGCRPRSDGLRDGPRGTGRERELHPDDLGPQRRPRSARQAARRWDSVQATSDIMGYMGTPPRRPRQCRART